jgi:hypothetical protein
MIASTMMSMRMNPECAPYFACYGTKASHYANYTAEKRLDKS